MWVARVASAVCMTIFFYATSDKVPRTDSKGSWVIIKGCKARNSQLVGKRLWTSLIWPAGRGRSKFQYSVQLACKHVNITLFYKSLYSVSMGIIFSKNFCVQFSFPSIILHILSEHWQSKLFYSTIVAGPDPELLLVWDDHLGTKGLLILAPLQGEHRLQQPSSLQCKTDH